MSLTMKPWEMPAWLRNEGIICHDNANSIFNIYWGENCVGFCIEVTLSS